MAGELASGQGGNCPFSNRLHPAEFAVNRMTETRMSCESTVESYSTTVGTTDKLIAWRCRAEQVGANLPFTEWDSVLDGWKAHSMPVDCECIYRRFDF